MSRLLWGLAGVPDEPLRPRGHRSVTYTVCVSMGRDPEQSKDGGGWRLLPWLLKMKRVEAGRWLGGENTRYTSMWVKVQTPSIRHTLQLLIIMALKRTGTEVP